MRIKFIFFLISLLIASCAKIPMQSIALMASVKDEGKRMHTINTSLINELFNEKRKKIDEFIKKEYTPNFIEEFIKKIPSSTDVKLELPNILLSIIPKIIERRDAMQNALEVTRIKVIENLNQGYNDYEIACVELKKLLESAVQVADERKKNLQKASEFSKNKLDFEQLGVTVDSFITDSGDFGKNVTNLNENVNKLLNK